MSRVFLFIFLDVTKIFDKFLFTVRFGVRIYFRYIFVGDGSPVPRYKQFRKNGTGNPSPTEDIL